MLLISCVSICTGYKRTDCVFTESGRLEFDEFVTLAAKFIVEEDDETMQKELKEAFRLYDKEGKFLIFSRTSE